MAKITFLRLSTVLRISVILVHTRVQPTNGFLNGLWSRTTYTTIEEVSPEKVVARMAPMMNEMKYAVVNKTEEEIDKVIAEYSQKLSSSFSNYVKMGAKNLKQILSQVVEVEDDTVEMKDLLVKILDTVDKEQEMWTTGQVELIVFGFLGVIICLLLVISGMYYRHHTKTELILKWLLSCARVKHELRPNDKANYVSYTKKNLEDVNPLVTYGPDV